MSARTHHHQLFRAKIAPKRLWRMQNVCNVSVHSVGLFLRALVSTVIIVMTWQLLNIVTLLVSRVVSWMMLM